MHLAAILALACASVHAYDSVEFLQAYQDPSLKAPSAVAAAGGRLYVTDPQSSVLAILDLKDGRLLGKSEAKSKTADGLTSPSAVAVAADGTVYVADTGNHRVVMLDKDGKLLGWFGGKGSEPGQMASPEGVAVGPDGRVYVADTRNHRVQIYGKDGIFMLGFGAEAAPMSRPTRLAVDASEGVYVLDDGGERLRRFTFEGAAWKAAAMQAKGAGFAIAPTGWVYAADANAGKIKEFDGAGAMEGAFGTAGKGAGQFKSPSDVAADADGSILIADPGNARVLRYKVENKSPRPPVPVSPRTKIILTGPTWTSPQKIGAFVPLKAGLVGYKLDSRELVLLNDKGEVSLKFGPHGKDAGQVREPKALAWSKEHGIFVSDTGNDRIQFFSIEGKPTGLFGEKTGFFDSKSKEGRVNDPEGVAIGDKGTVYIADTSNARVQAFSPQGVFLFTIGPKIGGLDLAQPCALEFDPKGRLYILDRKLKKVIVTEANGKFVSAWGQVGEGPSQWTEPVAMAYDGHNYIYVLDRTAARLRVYDVDGRWVMNYFSRGKGDKSLVEPSAMAFEGARLFISDPGASRVASYEVRPILAPPARVETAAAEGKATLSWSGTVEPWVKTFHVERAETIGGPYTELSAKVEKVEVPAAPGLAGSSGSRIVDTPDTYYTTYYYRVSAEAKTGDVGPPSNPIAVYVPGSFNAPPVELAKIDLDYVFSANYKYYLKNPIGKLVIQNNVEANFVNAKLTFFLKDFMDFPSQIDVPEVKSRGKTEVPLIVTLNNKILELSEDTPILAEFKITYYEQGKEQTISRTKPIKVLSRNAIIWDRPERMANFVTPNDDPIVDFRAAALNADPKPKHAPANSQLNSALAIWTALSVQGVRFQTDPVNPYASLKGAEDHPLDRVQMPRETLRRKSGECDDLVGLLASAFEAAGVESALLDYPAHLALAINLRTSDPLDAGIPEDQLVSSGGSLWLPIEATMLGKPFTQSLEQAMQTYKKAAKAKEARLIPLSDARKEFDPVSLPKDGEKLEPLDKAAIETAFLADAERLHQDRLTLLRGHYEGLLAKDAKNQDAIVGLGIVEAQGGDAAAAQKRFEEALALEPQNAAALNNLGNLAYEKGDYAAAKEAYEKAVAADPHDGGVWLNVVRANVKLGDAKAAKAAAAEAAKVDDSLSSIAKAIMELKP